MLPIPSKFLFFLQLLAFPRLLASLLLLPASPLLSSSQLLRSALLLVASSPPLAFLLLLLPPLGFALLLFFLLMLTSLLLLLVSLLLLLAALVLVFILQRCPSPTMNSPLLLPLTIPPTVLAFPILHLASPLLFLSSLLLLLDSRTFLSFFVPLICPPLFLPTLPSLTSLLLLLASIQLLVSLKPPFSLPRLASRPLLASPAPCLVCWKLRPASPQLPASFSGHSSEAAAVAVAAATAATAASNIDLKPETSQPLLLSSFEDLLRLLHFSRTFGIAPPVTAAAAPAEAAAAVAPSLAALLRVERRVSSRLLTVSSQSSSLSY